MSRLFLKPVRSFISLFGFLFDLMGDGLRFLGLTVGSHSALSAEILFLRKQLAFYEERETQPRRLNDSARLSLVFWSRLFDWKSALVIVKPETLIGWHRTGFKLFWKWKSRTGRPATARKHPQAHRPHGVGKSDLGTSSGGSRAVGEARHLCLPTHGAGLLASRAGAARATQDL